MGASFSKFKLLSLVDLRKEEQTLYFIHNIDYSIIISSTYSWSSGVQTGKKESKLLIERRKF